MNRINANEFIDTFNEILEALNYSSEDDLKESIQKTWNNIKNIDLNFKNKMQTSINGLRDEIEDDIILDQGTLFEIENKEDIPRQNFSREERNLLREKTLKKIMKEKQELLEKIDNEETDSIISKIMGLIPREQGKSRLQIPRNGAYILNEVAKDYEGNEVDIKIDKKGNKIVLVATRKDTAASKNMVEWLYTNKPKKTISSVLEMIEYISEQDDVFVSQNLYKELLELLNLNNVTKVNGNIENILKSLQKH